MNIRKLMLIFGFVFLFGLAANALPALQLYVEGAAYDDESESWLLNGALSDGTARVWVIGNTGGKGNIIDVNLAIAYAYNELYTPTFTLSSSTVNNSLFPGVVDPSTPIAPVSNTILDSVNSIPTLSDGSSLPSHGIYGTGENAWQEFGLGNLTEVDSPIADFNADLEFPDSFVASGMGQINVYDVEVSGFPESDDNFLVHFDVYNSVEGKTHALFAPFSHDADFSPLGGPPPVPEPMGMAMLGFLGIGMFMAKKFRKKEGDSSS